MNYLPGVEVGARRLLDYVIGGEENSEGWRKEVTQAVVDSGKTERLSKLLQAGHIVS